MRTILVCAPHTLLSVHFYLHCWIFCSTQSNPPDQNWPEKMLLFVSHNTISRRPHQPSSHVHEVKIIKLPSCSVGVLANAFRLAHFHSVSQCALDFKPKCNLSLWPCRLYALSPLGLQRTTRARSLLFHITLLPLSSVLLCFRMRCDAVVLRCAPVASVRSRTRQPHIYSHLLLRINLFLIAFFWYFSLALIRLLDETVDDTLTHLVGCAPVIGGSCRSTFESIIVSATAVDTA